MEGVASQQTKHIEKMISRQQNKKGGGGGGPRLRKGGGGQGFFPNYSGGAGGYGGFTTVGMSGVPGRGGGGGRRPPMVVVKRPAAPPASDDFGPRRKATLPPRLQRCSPGEIKQANVFSVSSSKHIAPVGPKKRLGLDLGAEQAAVVTERVFLKTEGGPAVYGTRLKDILQDRVHGLFATQVEKLYQKAWGESLPNEWMVRAEASGALQLGRDNPTATLVYPADCGQDLPPLSLPPGDEWDVTVCSVQTANAVCVWLNTGVAALVAGMEQELAATMVGAPRYDGGPLPRAQLVCGLLAPNRAVRARVTRLDRVQHTAMLLLLDWGEQRTFSWSQLAPLHPRYMSTPGQALLVTLAGVETPGDQASTKYVEKKLLGKHMVGVKVEEVGNNNTPALVLFDYRDKEVLISQEIIDALEQNLHLKGFNPQQTAGVSRVDLSLEAMTRSLKGSLRISVDQSKSGREVEAKPPVPRAVCGEFRSPKLPNEGEYFDVVVSNIISPDEFFVQAFSDSGPRAELEVELARHCRSAGMAELQLGKAIAARVSVLSMVLTGSTNHCVDHYLL